MTIVKKPQDTLFYVNQVYCDELSGQGSFERGLMFALEKRLDPQFGNLVFFTAHKDRASIVQKGKVTTYFNILNKRTLIGYLIHQWRLLWCMGLALWQHRQENVSIYARYNVSLISPLILAIIFGKRFTFRCGPIFPSMKVYRPDTSHLIYWFLRPLLWFFFRKAHRVIVITNTVAAWVKSTFPFASRKIRIVHNGADINKFRPLTPVYERWGRNEEDFILGYVGFIDQDQGLHTVIQSLSMILERKGRMPHLLVVGDGPKKKDYEKLSSRLKLDSYITWMGQQPNADIPSFLAICNVMLLPLTHHSIEVRGTSAMKLFEYIACDKFILASRCEDLIFLEEKGIGELVEPESPIDLGNAIQNLMVTPDRWNMKGKARSVGVENFSFDVVAAKIWEACFDV